jgi:Pyruvate/2-oxoacid:ferredoxin oxidoreductase gamma subunit
MMQDDVKKNGIGFYKLIDAKNRNVFVFVMHDGEYTYVYAFGSESFTQDSVSIKVVINETVLFHVNVPMMSPTDKVPYRIKIVESKTPDAEFAYHTTHNEKSCNIDVKNSTDEDIIILCEDLATNYRLGQKIIFANGMQRIRCTIMDSKYSNGIMHITICAEDDELQTWVVRLNDDESTLIYDDDDRTTAEIERAYEDMTEEEQVALATRLSLM